MRLKLLASGPHTFTTVGLLCTVLLSGCAATPVNPDDPWEGWNRSVHSFNEDLDHYIMKPIAKGYDYVTPEPVSQGITNFFSNIDDIGVILNDIFQLKLAQAGKDTGRFFLNTTLGLGGFFDVASEVDLPKNIEDFDQTLGYWGVPTGPYLVLPFIGPGSPRGVAGLVGDALMDPLTYTMFAGAAVSAASTAANAVEGVDKRAGLLSSEKILDEAAVDRYEFIKTAYFQRREYLINDGVMLLDDHDDLFDDLDDYFEDEDTSHHLQLDSPADQ
ncbi:MAG: VacJ family lipoprotein [Gammaproteobacteria bacterium]|nr:VacJ family lipoprotein [Gammaproteobacteria bacterium]